MSQAASKMVKLVAMGEARVGEVTQFIKTDSDVRYNGKWAKFHKERPGVYVVQVGKADEDKPFQTFECANAMEAKFEMVASLLARENAKEDTDD